MKIFTKIFAITFLVITSTFAQTSYGYDITPTFAIPTGKNAEFYKIGIGATTGFYYDMNSNTRIGLSLGFIRFGIDEKEINKTLSENAQSFQTDLTGSLSTIPIVVTFKLISPGSAIRFYGVIEGGLYLYWTKAEGKYILENGTADIDESEFRSEAGFVVGMGTLFPLQEELSLDFNVKYHLVQDSEYINVDPYHPEVISTSQALTIGIGLIWNFLIE